MKVFRSEMSVQVMNKRVHTRQKDNTATFLVYNKHKFNLRDNTVRVVSELAKPQSACSNETKSFSRWTRYAYITCRPAICVLCQSFASYYSFKDKK